MEFLQIQGNEVAHVDMLQVLPGPLDRVQVRGVWRQELHSQATTGGGTQELLDCHAAVNRRPVPDHLQPWPHVTDQMLEELDGMQAVERLLTH